ncbi:MAG: phospho-sugar mutase [Cyclobacteriaceae bacterium]|nr:phospho-sugar mutase [Cyclobacteriaceae bacterium]
MNAREKAKNWLSQNIDKDIKEGIQALLDGPEIELTEAFYKDLEFGTGGLRGIMGVGSNRMNKYTLGMATQGLSNYLNKTFTNEEIKVAIAYDCRNNSAYFAEITSAVFSANGIKVYVFEELRPTPELSFAIRTLGCKSGVVLTASHNPKEYNGYKAYWDDGAQVTPPHDANIIKEVQAIKSLTDIKFEANHSLIEKIGEEIDKQYLHSIKSLALDQEAITKENDINIVYSSIHGTGITMVPPALDMLGFTNVNIVEEQAEPNGNFPTVIYPNPEEAEALTLALKLANETKADLLMATDPDADRVGIAAMAANGRFELMNGNQLISLLAYYTLNKRKELDTLNTSTQYMVKTIVSTDLFDTICADYNMPCYNTLTGFKYIATTIRELEGPRQFIGGGEESYGYMPSAVTRDKDAVATCALIAEMAADAKSKGKTLWDVLNDIYTKYGVWYDSMTPITRKGITGAEEIKAKMKQFRECPPTTLGGEQVVIIKDYFTGKEKDLKSGQETILDFPTSNVLQFFTASGSKISVRPSGTEPKIKFYFSLTRTILDKSDILSTNQMLKTKVEEISNDLNLNQW